MARRAALKLALCMQCLLTWYLADAFAASLSQSLQTFPNIGPTQFLLVSSPSLGKVVYTQLVNFESSAGRSFALVSTGLTYPMGLAFDRKHGCLYVADKGASAIYRYRVLVDNAGLEPSLITTGARLTIMQGHPVEWLTMDMDGNLFYTAPDTDNINRIDAVVLAKIANGDFTSSSLQIVSQKTISAEASALSNSSSDSASNSSATVEPRIVRVYEATVNPLVSSPSGLWADGLDLYWTNTEDGETSGTIVKGETNPTLMSNPNGADFYNATAVTKASAGAINLAKVGNIMFFTQNGTDGGSGSVSALLMSTGDVSSIITSLEQPRGIVWDGDQTLFVADQAGGNVWCFPSGRFMANPPLTLAVILHGAYGLDLLSEADPWYANSITNVS